jgi:NhaP-type Na+/H+ or K+/H+ antiporter
MSLMLKNLSWFVVVMSSVWPTDPEITKINVTYIAMGGFMTLFAFSSSFIKERLFLSEALVGALFGIVMGPTAANVLNQSLFGGNIDTFMLEFCRLIVGIQCFAAGVQSPGDYVKREWKSLATLLGPVMLVKWAISSVIVKYTLMFEWKESMIIAGCVTPTDPVLANSLINGAFAEQHIPERLRLLISAESGLNDGLGLMFFFFPFFLSSYSSVAEGVGYWIVQVLIYQVLLAVILGILIGYSYRKLLQIAHERKWIDKESFLSLSLAVAVLILGIFSRMGIDDILGCFVAGAACSWDMWLNEELKGSHIQEVIDTLMNITFFIFFGTRIEWNQVLNIPGVSLVQLLGCCCLLILFRRLPVVLAFKRMIPATKSWAECFFCGVLAIDVVVRSNWCWMSLLFHGCDSINGTTAATSLLYCKHDRFIFNGISWWIGGALSTEGQKERNQ